jgi:hypothetical protein
MSLRLLADQCVPTEILDLLIRAGHHVTKVRDVMSIRSPDSAVITKAQELECIPTLPRIIRELSQFSFTIIPKSFHD